MDSKIKKLLDSNKIKYKLVEHKKVYTAFNEAETQHIDPKSVVKTVFVKLSKPTTHLVQSGDIKVIDSVLVAVPAKHRVDFKKIAKAVNDHAAKSYKQMTKNNPKVKKPAAVSVKMANEKDITKILKTKIGLLHPFGEVFGVPLLLDKKLGKNKKVIVPAGSYTESLEINYKDILKITPGMEGNFTE
jgi:Ala-tRNA(Pro) deacylase